jgi:hypothetical protein
MTNLTQSSPFDSIRHEDEQGEYWLATELLTLFGYKTWKRQKDTVERAIISCQNSGNDSASNFAEVVQMAQIGDSQAYRSVVRDYKLSRLGCYLTAMNGDPRKPEIASAQSYFAIKAREAEVIIPQQSERLRELELQVALAQANAEMMKCERDLFEKRAEIYKFHGQDGLAQVSDREPAVIDRQVIESINIPQGTRYKGQTLPQIVDYVRKRYGLRLKNGGVIVKLLKAAEKDNLIQKMPRKVDQDYIPEEHLPQVYKLLTDGNRQMLIGE